MNKLYKPVIVKKIINDEHFYFVDGKYLPAVTHVLAETLPMPYALRYWLGEVGNERAQQKLEKAGDRGTAIHEACEKLIMGEELNLTKEFPISSDKKVLVGFINWFAEFQPKLIKGTQPELILASQKGYAGTLDLPVVLRETPTIVDIKTSAGVYDSHKLQLVAYRQAFKEMYGIETDIAILHLTPKAKKGFIYYDQSKLMIDGKPVTIDDFMTVIAMYKVLHGGKIPEPPEVDEYPEILKLEKIIE